MRGVAALFILSIAGFMLGFWLTFEHKQQSSEVVLRFDHSKHQALACEVCHLGVLDRSSAVIPTQRFCAKCHNDSPDKSPDGTRIWQASEQGAPYMWPVSYRLSSHVYFSHRRHVEIAQLACQSCHPNMSQRSTPVFAPLNPLAMNDCLACHRKMNATTDCARCHR
jgi:c(7)-type cytochrome triheme protein